MGRWLDDYDFAAMVARLTQQPPLVPPLREVKRICEAAVYVLSKEPNVLHLSMPLYVVGDIHGQFQDLLEVFRITGPPPTEGFLFLGDFVDRGVCGVETMVLLLVLKLRYPNRVHLLRGNHEQVSAAKTYGFYQECISKFGTPHAMKLFASVFDFLPIAASVGGEVFCVHGGLSPLTPTLDHISAVERNKFDDSNSPMGHLLWSDPDERPGFHNNTRGAGFLFGPDMTDLFCHTNDFGFIARAHQLTMQGFSWTHNDSLVTVFSAPNYCYRMQNLGAVMHLRDAAAEPDFVQYGRAPGQAAEQPPRLRGQAAPGRRYGGSAARWSRQGRRPHASGSGSGSRSPSPVEEASVSGTGGWPGAARPPRLGLRNPLDDPGEESGEALLASAASPFAEATPRTPGEPPDVAAVRASVDARVASIRALTLEQAASKLGVGWDFVSAMPSLPVPDPHAALVAAAAMDAKEAERAAAEAGVGFPAPQEVPHIRVRVVVGEESGSVVAGVTVDCEAAPRPPARLPPIGSPGSTPGKLKALRGGGAASLLPPRHEHSPALRHPGLSPAQNAVDKAPDAKTIIIDGTIGMDGAPLTLEDTTSPQALGPVSGLYRASKPHVGTK